MRAQHGVHRPDRAGRELLAALIRADYERFHPGDTFEQLERRASFSKAAKGLVRDWLAVAAARLAAEEAGTTRADIAA
jgi:hypothetical protein